MGRGGGRDGVAAACCAGSRTGPVSGWRMLMVMVPSWEVMACGMWEELCEVLELLEGRSAGACGIWGVGVEVKPLPTLICPSLSV